MNIFLKIFIIILAILTAYVFYYYIIYRKILYPTCLVDSNTCVQIEYYTIENSILFHMLPTGFWIMYDGNRYAYTLGHNSGKNCIDNINYDAAYVTDLRSKNREINGYTCIKKLSKLIDEFSRNNEKKFIFYRVENPNEVNIYDVLNFLNKRRIINLENI